MPASEQAYLAGPDGELHPATLDRKAETVGGASVDLCMAELSEQVDHANPGYVRPDRQPDPEEHDYSPDN